MAITDTGGCYSLGALPMLPLPLHMGAALWLFWTAFTNLMYHLSICDLKINKWTHLFATSVGWDHLRQLLSTSFSMKKPCYPYEVYLRKSRKSSFFTATYNILFFKILDGLDSHRILLFYIVMKALSLWCITIWRHLSISITQASLRS